MATDMVTNSRAEVLRRVRAARGGTSDGVAVRAGWDGIAREYRRKGTREREGLLALLEDRLRDYDARVVRAAGEGVGQSVAKRLVERGVRRMVVPVGLPVEWMPVGWLPASAGEVEFVVDEGLSSEELDDVDGVMTGATLAIAETGTFVLQNVAGQGRRAATLVPDYHLCVVRAEDVVETVPEAMGRLQETAGLATTFVSGPSATADIEMTRIKGVHGPRSLDVILIV
ncbi:LutC/YkgG family protein [Tunturibacter empetritectus]|uniref:L-lactate dehydrogenase complex protein LldG n=1 Tax=Tunturiibacter empetritectus TaxID=3069691 RepID=A0A7W8IFW0_9BACT|nr:LUD domain-containing protein [Edaphobacter lichenicola]MBB5316449.1 L-lactate dehydrogenase complex protein LldG [Edaphobacter lichenicola]